MLSEPVALRVRAVWTKTRSCGKTGPTSMECCAHLPAHHAVCAAGGNALRGAAAADATNVADCAEIAATNASAVSVFAVSTVTANVAAAEDVCGLGC